jgi:hypothetical protein
MSNRLNDRIENSQNLESLGCCQLHVVDTVVHPEADQRAEHWQEITQTLKETLCSVNC